MGKKKLFFKPKRLPLSKRMVYVRIIFWVFVVIMALQALILSAMYMIYEAHDFKILSQILLTIAVVSAIGTSVTLAVVGFIRWFSSHTSIQSINRSDKEDNILTDLHEAVEKSSLALYYQPLVTLQSGEIHGMEALIRWHHSEKGFISPSEFIPLAEDSGLIVPISEWVLKTACEQTKRWLDQGINLRVSVNMSTLLFQEENVVEIVASILQSTKLPPQNLELEITETAMIADTDRAIAVMYKLRDLGIFLSMDDFGTGYSSLSNLDRFPVHKLKIDRTFVVGINEYDSEPTLADAIVQMGRSLHLKTLVEGIETDYQKNYFNKLRCDEGQGYYFGAPMPAHEFIRSLQTPENNNKAN